MTTIYFDCDGTWIDLYGVEGWLDDLIAHCARPYIEAKPLLNLSRFARTLHRLQAEGYRIGIISWLAKDSTEEFDAEVTAAKLQYFKRHLPSVQWDEIHIVPYGTPKSSCGKGILFDDEERNRIEWGDTAFDETKIFEVLKSLL